MDVKVCPVCNGKGVVNNEDCVKCDGEGQLLYESTPVKIKQHKNKLQD